MVQNAPLFVGFGSFQNFPDAGPVFEERLPSLGHSFERGFLLGHRFDVLLKLVSLHFELLQFVSDARDPGLAQPIHLVNTDPPYNVKVEPRSNSAIAAGNSSFAATGKHHQKFDLARHPEKSKPTQKKMRAKDRPLANDFVSDEEFDRLLLAWFGNIARVLLPGHGFYVWGGYANVANYPPVFRACQLYFSQAVIWHKIHPVLTRKDFMGDHEWCQPPDTQVVTSDGTSRIAGLRDGDKVLTFSSAWSGMIGHRNGPQIQVGQRQYGGPLYGISVGNRTTWSGGKGPRIVSTGRTTSRMSGR